MFCLQQGTSPGSSGSFAHEKLDWLKEENRKCGIYSITTIEIDIIIYRDAAGRHVTDPAYDAHTLHIPADYMRKQTPGHKQWWIEKSKHFDAVIFFKVSHVQ